MMITASMGQSRALLRQTTWAMRKLLAQRRSFTSLRSPGAVKWPGLNDKRRVMLGTMDRARRNRRTAFEGTSGFLAARSKALFTVPSTAGPSPVLRENLRRIGDRTAEWINKSHRR